MAPNGLNLIEDKLAIVFRFYKTKHTKNWVVKHKELWNYTIYYNKCWKDLDEQRIKITNFLKHTIKLTFDSFWRILYENINKIWLIYTIFSKLKRSSLRQLKLPRNNFIEDFQIKF